MNAIPDGEGFVATIVVLAAGSSKRLGDVNKLLYPLGDLSIVGHSVGAAVRAGLGEVIVVTGADRERIRTVLAGYPVRFIHNPAYEEGMGSSLKEGVRSAAAGGIGVCLADMPFIGAGTITELGEVLVAHPGSIVVPVFEGRRGHPVFFSEQFRADLLELEGDEGARRILTRHPNAVVEVRTEDRGILQDIDTQADIDLLQGGEV